MMSIRSFSAPLFDTGANNTADVVFRNAAERAFPFIFECEKDQLEYAHIVLSWMRDQLNPSKSDRLTIIPKDPPKEERFVTQLFNNRLIFNLDDLDMLSWPQYFALYAIQNINNAWFMDKMLQNKDTSKKNMAMLPGAILANAVDAMESVCYAEFLSQSDESSEKIAQKVKNVISMRNSKPAIKRHSYTNTLKREFIEYYYSGEFPSKAEAIRRFYKSLPEDRRNPTQENIVRLLTTALKDFETGQIPL